MSGFIDDSDFLTVSDQTSRLTRSRRVAAGSHITLDSTVPGVLTVNSPRTFGTATACERHGYSVNNGGLNNCGYIAHA